MDLKTAVEKLGGSYDDLLSRLMNEALVRKFFTKFLNEQSFNELKETLAADNTEEAFKAAHTLKGVCQNLAFGTLGHSSSECCEALRSGDLESGKKLFEKVQADYDEVISVLNQALV